MARPNRSPVRLSRRPLIQRLALAWLRYELNRRAAAALREDERRAVIQVKLAPRPG